MRRLLSLLALPSAKELFISEQPPRTPTTSTKTKRNGQDFSHLRTLNELSLSPQDLTNINSNSSSSSNNNNNNNSSSSSINNAYFGLTEPLPSPLEEALVALESEDSTDDTHDRYTQY